MSQTAKSAPVRLAEFAGEFQLAAASLESRCRLLLPEPHSRRARNQILNAARHLRLYLQYSEAGTYRCLESDIQARKFRAGLYRAVQSCADGLNRLEARETPPQEAHFQLARNLASWASRKVPTFPGHLNRDTYELEIRAALQ